MRFLSYSFLAIIFVAFLIRFLGVNYGLPYLYNPDEPVNLDNILRLASLQEPNPFFSNYPPLFFYVQVPFYALFLQFVNPPSMHVLSIGNGIIDQPFIVLIGRTITLFFSMGLVALVFFSSWKVTRDPRASSLAAILAAFSPISLENAGIITPNAMVAFFATATLLMSLVLFKYGKAKYYIFAGILVGVTAGSKYNGAAVLLAPVLAHFLYTQKSKNFFNLNLLKLIAAAGTTFILAAPTVITSPGTFIGGVDLQFTHYASGHFGVTGNSLLYYIERLLLQETGALLFAVLGILSLLRVRQKEILIISSFFLTYLIFISSFQTHLEPILTPLLGAMYILAGYGCKLVLDWSRSNSFFKASAYVSLFLAIGMVAYFGLRTTYNLMQDSRSEARQWINKHIPAGSNIIVEAYGPWVDQEKYHVIGVVTLVQSTPESYLDHKVNYLIAGQDEFARVYAEPNVYPAEFIQYQTLFNKFPTVARFNQNGYQIKILKVQ